MTVYGTPPTSVKPGARAAEEPTLVVLAGGRGRRLGLIPKGLIRLGNGETVVERLVGLAPGPVLVSANQPEWYERLGVPIVGDLVPDKGAPGGVVTGLAMAGTEWVLVVACDMPWVNRAMLDALWQRRHAGVDAVCFTRGEALEPLVGLYRRALVFDWAPRLEGNPSMRALVSSTRAEAVEAAEPERLLSLNSPEDLRRASESFGRLGDAVTVVGNPW